MGFFAHDSCFLGPALSPGRHFPRRPPFGALCPVQMSRPQLHTAQARKRRVSPWLGEEPCWDGVILYLGVEQPGALLATQPIGATCPQGGSAPFTRPHSGLPGQCQPPLHKPKPGLSLFFPLGPQMGSETVLSGGSPESECKEGSRVPRKGVGRWGPKEAQPGAGLSRGSHWSGEGH